MRVCRMCGAETPEDDVAVPFQHDDRHCVCASCIGRVANTRPHVSRTLVQEIEAVVERAERPLY